MSPPPPGGEKSHRGRGNAGRGRLGGQGPVAVLGSRSFRPAAAGMVQHEVVGGGPAAMMPCYPPIHDPALLPRFVDATGIVAMTK